jgi:hypothetical protein
MKNISESKLNPFIIKECELNKIIVDEVKKALTKKNIIGSSYCKTKEKEQARQDIRKVILGQIDLLKDIHKSEQSIKAFSNGKESKTFDFNQFQEGFDKIKEGCNLLMQAYNLIIDHNDCIFIDKNLNYSK